MYYAFDENLHSHGSSVCICPDFSIEICSSDATGKAKLSKKQKKFEHFMMRLVP